MSKTDTDHMQNQAAHTHHSHLRPDPLDKKSSSINGSRGSEGCFSDSDKGSSDNEHDVPPSGVHSNTRSRMGSNSTVYYEQEPFESYKLKVVKLCQDIGYGTPSEIERIEGGSYNRIIGVAFSSSERHDYVLRIPRHVLDADEAHEIKDQVAVLRYLSRYDFLRVPSIAKYDLSKSNALDCQYVLQERIKANVSGTSFVASPYQRSFKSLRR